MQVRLDDLAAGVTRATDQIAVALRAAETGQPPSHRFRSLGRLPPLRAQQQAIGPQPSADSEDAGLFAATDGLVDAINTAAHVLRGGGD
jgi:hypothetical protein